jgi:hypothetical protein
MTAETALVIAGAIIAVLSLLYWRVCWELKQREWDLQLSREAYLDLAERYDALCAQRETA